MGNVDINNNQWIRVKSAAGLMNKSVERAHGYCLTLKDTTESVSWKGATRDQFITYIEIIEQYHTKLNEILQLQTEALDNLADYCEDFRNEGIVKAVNRL